MVLLKVEIFEFCLGFSMRRSSDLSMSELDERFPIILPVIGKTAYQSDGVDNVLYGTVAEMPRSSHCAESVLY